MDHTKNIARLLRLIQKAELADLRSNVKGINKFIALCNSSNIITSAMVNDKGLAGSADMDLVKKIKNPKYRGLMNNAILRYIAEKAADCDDALNIIQDFVGKGYYAGGTNGTNWTFVDKQGKILEIYTNHSNAPDYKYHDEKLYITRL